MDGTVVVVGLCTFAVALATAGGLMVGTRARASGLATLLTAALVLAGACTWPDARTTASVLLAAATGVGALPALLVYPRLEWRHPVDFVALVAVLACGAVTTGLAPHWTPAGSLVMVSVVLYLAHAMWRFERADEEDRVAVLWLVLALGTATLVFGPTMFLLPTLGSAAVGLLCACAVPAVMALGVRRPHLVDVRALTTEAVVFAVAVLCFVAVFVGLATVLDLTAGDGRTIGLLAVIGGLAAAGFHPLRVSLRGVIDELLFGERPDPLDAATRVADRIGDDPVLALRAVRESLLLPYAALVVDGEELAVSGTAVTHTRRLPLQLGGDTVGEIVVGLRVGDLGLSKGDEDVLRIVAPLLAQTLRARALAADLQESRGHAIAAIEEERRRLRRDLHDGLGPTLSGIAFTADAARNTMGQSPDQAEELLRGLRSDARNAIGEIRRLVYDMRPPALDELGLVPALRQRASQLRTARGTALHVVLDAPDDLPALPAAVEVAAYRITLEALTNTARHSGSDRATVRLGVLGDQLSLEVCDDGRTEGDWAAGVGLSSMRERAAEVGGSLVAVGGPGGGRVDAVLPL